MIKCSRKPSTRCYVCGKPMTSLCDATRKDGKPCDMPMCDEHRNRIATDLDVCKYHNYPKYIEQARENRIKREEARLYFIEEYQKQDFRVVPGHWPDFATKEDVDKWIDFQNKVLEMSRELFNEIEE
ncbi:MAG: hypothetical protein M0Q88_02990 [Bacilli bacterium]|nr:hypothetical protein [Bacilli bacterium]